MRDAMAANPPRAQFNDLSTVARDEALTWAVSLVTTLRADGVKQLGQVAVVPMTTSRVDADSVEVVACVDVSKVDVVNKWGKSVIGPGRLPRSQATYVVDQVGSTWLVTTDDHGGKVAC
jgi:hypothetical protein